MDQNAQILFKLQLSFSVQLHFLSFITLFKIRIYVTYEGQNIACLLKICIRKIIPNIFNRLTVLNELVLHAIEHKCCIKEKLCFLLELDFPPLSQFSSRQQVKLSFVSFTHVHRYSFYWKFHSLYVLCWYQRNPFKAYEDIYIIQRIYSL